MDFVLKYLCKNLKIEQNYREKRKNYKFCLCARRQASFLDGTACKRDISKNLITTGRAGGLH